MGDARLLGIGRGLTPFDHGSRSLLTHRDLGRFPGETLFDRVGRVLCAVERVPRKELYESWEVARRARRRFRGGRVVDLACGHGLVAHLAMILDDGSPSAVAADPHLPPSAHAITEALCTAWPRLVGRVSLEARRIEDVPIERGDVVLSAHACGSLTDQVLERAIAANARVAVLPCCHDADRNDTGGLDGWLDAPLAIDVTRAARLRAHGYAVRTQTIPSSITPKNRLLVGEPISAPSGSD